MAKTTHLLKKAEEIWTAGINSIILVWVRAYHFISFSLRLFITSKHFPGSAAADFRA